MLETATRTFYRLDVAADDVHSKDCPDSVTVRMERTSAVYLAKSILEQLYDSGDGVPVIDVEINGMITWADSIEG